MSKLYSTSRPEQLAKDISAEASYSGKPIVLWNDEWFQWTGKIWAKVRIERVIMNACILAETQGRKGPIPYPTTTDARSNVKSALVEECLFDARTHTWVFDDHPDVSPRDIIVTKEGLIDVSERVMMDADPAFFAVSQIGCVPKPSPCPRWMQFIASLGLEQDELVCLQEFLGLCLVADTRHQKMLQLIGEPRSGKGTILRIISAILGDAVAATNPLQMSSQFGSRQLVGKLLVTMSDARFSGQNIDQCTERLLTISGEDCVVIEGKGRDAFTSRLQCRVIVASNAEVKLPDSSGVIAKRWLTIPFRVSFEGREDIGLEDALLAELDGIAWWMLDGLESLRARGRFLEPQSSIEVKHRAEEAASPVISFVRDCCELRPEAGTSRDILWAAWKEWAVRCGHHTGSRQTFLSTIRMRFRLEERRSGNVRMVHGIALAIDRSMPV